MTDTDQDKPEVIEKRMTDALRNALRTPPKHHKQGEQSDMKRGKGK